MKSINISMTKIRRSSRVLFRIVRDRVYIFDEDHGRLYSLNETASFVWSLINKPVFIEDVIKGVVIKYDVNPMRAKKDIKELVALFYQRKIIKLYSKKNR